MLKIINNIYIAILALFVVCACSHDELIETPLAQDEIVFSATSGKVTRAGEASLAKYIENFRIYGTNTKEGNNSLVFRNYVLWYDEETTKSNTSNWEYVGYDPVDNKLQTIKYWDFSAFPYTFWAIAGAERGEFEHIAATGEVERFETTLSEELDGGIPMVYYTKPTVITKEQYADPVTFHFVGAHSRIRFAFYETVPGYAVKNVKFHIGSETAQYSECTVNGLFNVSGKLTLEYDYTGTAPDVEATFADPLTSTSHAFGNLNYSKAASGWLGQYGGSVYLGVLSSAPTYAGNAASPGYYTNILPYPENNTSYTYLFKITDSELNPISFEAVGEIDNTTNNEQGTITTVDDYSITTHQKSDTDEEGITYESMPYIAERPIEIAVVKGDGSIKPKLDGTTDFVRIYHQTTVNEWIVEPSPVDPTVVYKEPVTYDANGIAKFTPSETGTYRIEYWHTGESVYRAVKIVAIGAILNSVGHIGTDLIGGDASHTLN